MLCDTNDSHSSSAHSYRWDMANAFQVDARKRNIEPPSNCPICSITFGPTLPKYVPVWVPPVMGSPPNLSHYWPMANYDLNILSLWPVLAPRYNLIWMQTEIKIPGPGKNQVSISELYLVQILTAGVINKEQTNHSSNWLYGWSQA